MVNMVALDQPLSELGLEPGPITSAAPTAPNSVVLPTGANFRLVIDEADRTASWTSSTTRDPGFDRFYVKGTSDRCASFTVSNLELPTLGDTFVTLPLTATTVLVSARDDGPWIIDRQGVHPVAGALPRWAGFRDSEGDIWLTGRPGDIWRGRFNPASGMLEGTTVLTTTEAKDPGRIAVVRTGTGAEVYVLEVDQWVRYSDGQGWRDVFGFPPVQAGLGISRSMAVSPSGDVLVMMAIGPVATLVRLEAGNVVESSVPLPFSEELTALDYVDGLGFVAAGSLGRLAVDRGDRHFVLLTTAATIGELYSIAGFRDGFLAAGGTGSFIQYSLSADRICLVSQGVPFGVRFIVPFGGGVLASGVNRVPDSKTVIAILNP
jgi:hypothetical protein